MHTGIRVFPVSFFLEYSMMLMQINTSFAEYLNWPWGEISFRHKLSFLKISPPQSLLPSNVQILNSMFINLFIIVFIVLVIHCVWQNNKIK